MLQKPEQRGWGVASARFPLDPKDVMKALSTWLGRDSPLLNCMNAAQQLALLVVLVSGQRIPFSAPIPPHQKLPSSEAQPLSFLSPRNLLKS
jgi:hypothetical protein